MSKANLTVSLLGEGRVRIEGSADFVSAISAMVTPYIIGESVERLALAEGITRTEAARRHMKAIDDALAKASKPRPKTKRP